ncbi:DUF748 domain-containing protein [Egbenema bharatensis]|uniref:DUF748 domain-containing protein n=1 Tax=Egbenema bharatensis TaxID=3463334 RepID=UPI003A841B51
MKLTHEIKPWRFILSRTGLFFSVFSGSVLLCGVTGVNWGVVYTQENLTPRLSHLLSQAIDRPVQLGSVERISPTGIRLGASAIPPTGIDRNQMQVEAIEMQLNLWKLLSQRQVKLTVTLIQPTIFLEQDEAGQWLNTRMTRSDEELVEIERVRLRNATVELMPRSKPMRSLVQNPEAQGIPVAPRRVIFQWVNLKATLPDRESPIQFALRGQAEAGGRFSIRGKANLNQQTAIAQVRCHQLAATALNPLLPPSARLDAGTFSSRMQIQIQPDQLPSLWGTARVDQLAAQVRREPNLLTQVNGRVQFQGQQITVQSANLIYGQIPIAQVTGTIDSQTGLDLRAQVAEAGVAEILQTFKLAVPFTVGGSIRADDLQITGTLKSAVFSGAAHHHQLIQTDRLQSAFQGQLTFDTRTRHLTFHELQFSPTLGGQVVAQGEVRVGKAAKGEPDDVDLSVEVRDLSGDQIAQLYDIPLPAAIGTINAQSQIQVFNEIPYLQGNWHLSQGSFPAQGTFALDGGTLRFRELPSQPHSEMRNAREETDQGRWQLTAESQPIVLVQAGMDQHQVAGKLNLTGSVDRPIETAQGTVQAQIQSDAGMIQAAGQLHQGQWQALIQSDDWDMANLSPAYSGLLTGEVNLAGSLTHWSPETIQAAGQLQLLQGISSEIAILNQPLATAFRWDAGKLHIQQLSMAGLEARGWVSSDFADRSPQITAVDLHLHLDDYDLETLPLPDLPLPIQGIANFQGRITGTPTQPQLDGTLHLQNFALNHFALDPDLRGPLTLTPDRQLSLDLAGNRDRIALVLDDQQRLAMLTVQIDQAIAQVIPAPATFPQPHHLLATLKDFPLETLNLSPFEAFGTVSGNLSGQFALNLTDATDPRVAGEIIIDRPAIGAVYASLESDTDAPGNRGSGTDADTNSPPNSDRFVGTVQYGDRTLALTAGTLHLGTGEYHLTSQLQLPVDPIAAPQFTAQLSTTSGNLEELQSRLPETTWEPLLAALPAALPDSLPTSPLEPPTLPPTPALPFSLPSSPAVNLRTLLPQQGNFATHIALHHSPQTGLSIAFNLQGEDWTWQDYRVRQIHIADGRFDGTSLSFSSALLQGLVHQPLDRPPRQYGTRLSFSGQVGQGQTGELQVKAIPVALVGHWLNLPIPLTGFAEGTFTLAGDVLNPDINGTIAVLNVHLNQREIKNLQIDFSYRNHQFRLQDWTVID